MGAPQGEGGGFNSNIEIYLRMRPHATAGASTYKLDEDKTCVQWSIPRQAQLGMINHQREHYNFSFTSIFDMDTKQDTIFETVAHKVVLGALDGYNGTIFAYGQTGSGKTYTITGGAERYVDRGVIPRSISLIFSDLAKRTEYTYIVHFSYLEIYNETGYDLLDPDHETKSLEDLPKVTLMEDDDNCIHLRNLSMHLASNEEEALNLLFVGDTNRMISATPMNMASSRSHCIFTATIEARKAGEDIVRRSKLHLVDLAGSERVSKTKVDGQILKEAKYINLSLHFLEQVIIALQERSQGKHRNHIPYRNSMMTSMLRDSLGGNCKTVMIATVSVAQDQLEETISTCRFAQRVAMVSNKVEINEEIDPTLLIKRLKQEILDLKDEIALLKATSEDKMVECSKTADDVEQIRKEILTFISDDSQDGQLNCGSSMFYIKNAFRIFKSLIKDSRDVKDQPAGACLESNDIAQSNAFDLWKQIQNLKYEIQQRDNEINILVSFIRKRQNELGNDTEKLDFMSKLQIHEPAAHGESSDVDTRVNNVLQGLNSPRPSIESSGSSPRNKLLFGRKQCFEIFCSNYPSMSSINENKAILKQKYQEAKALGDAVNKARENITSLKTKIEKQRVDRAMQNLIEGKDQGNTEHYGEDDELIGSIDAEKRVYRDGFTKLRDLKKEVEHLHTLLERSRVKLHTDFETWLGLLQGPVNAHNKHGSLTAGGDGSLDHPLSLSACSTASAVSTDVSLHAPLEASKGSGGSIMPVENQDGLRTPSLSSRSTCHGYEPAWPASMHGADRRDGRAWSANGLSVSEEDGRRRRQKKVTSQCLNGSTKVDRKEIMVTGNAEADADIVAFYLARSDFLNLKPQPGKDACAKG